MRQVQPTPRCLDGRGPEAVFDLLDGVIFTVVENDFLVDDGTLDARGQSPADAAALPRLDEVVLRAGIEGVLAFDEFRVENDVALLRRFGFEVGQPLPGLQVSGAGKAALRNRG